MYLASVKSSTFGELDRSCSPILIHVLYVVIHIVTDAYTGMYMHLSSLLQMPCTVCMYTHPSALICFAVKTMVFQQASKLVSYQNKFAAHLQTKQKNKSMPAGNHTLTSPSAGTSRYAGAKTPVATRRQRRSDARLANKSLPLASLQIGS